MSSSVSPVIVEAERGQHNATVIFFHGRGDTGHGWAETLTRLRPQYAKVICPTAPEIEVTLASGASMHAWFDLLTWYGCEGPEDANGIIKMGNFVHEMIDDERRKYDTPVDRILLGGYSQGGGLALHSALRYKDRLAGVLAMSCWLPLRNDYPAAMNEELKDIPVLQCHGETDPTIPVDWSAMTVDPIKRLMRNYEFKSYPGLGHSTCPPEMRDVRDFIAKCIPAVR